MTRASNDPWLGQVLLIKELPDLHARLEAIKHGHLEVCYNEAVMLIVDMMQILDHPHRFFSVVGLINYIVEKIRRLSKLSHGCL